MMQARRVGVALITAASIFSLAAVSVSAEDNGPTDPGVRCAAKVGPGQYEFYLPGEKATDVNGNKWVCGPDGQWFRDYSSALIKTTTYTTTTASLISSTAVYTLR